jgi:predicted RNA-binding Zn-ribbon protein involved in translation (DUF1610 family)
MTHTQAQGRTDAGGPLGRHKAVLICPRCGHESPVEGDWTQVVGSETVDVHCPDCWTRLTTRPR